MCWRENMQANIQFIGSAIKTLSINNSITKVPEKCDVNLQVSVSEPWIEPITVDSNDFIQGTIHLGLDIKLANANKEDVTTITLLLEGVYRARLSVSNQEFNGKR